MLEHIVCNQLTFGPAWAMLYPSHELIHPKRNDGMIVPVRG